MFFLIHELDYRINMNTKMYHFLAHVLLELLIKEWSSLIFGVTFQFL